MNCGSSIGPVEKFGFAIVQLFEASSNFDGPSGLNVVGRVETFDELAEQLDTLCFRQCHDLVENGFQSLAHKTEGYRGSLAEATDARRCRCLQREHPVPRKPDVLPTKNRPTTNSRSREGP